MRANWKGHEEIVRTLLEYQADVNAKDNNVRNQMMMMMMIIIVLTIMMMLMMMRIEMIADNNDRRLMYGDENK